MTKLQHRHFAIQDLTLTRSDEGEDKPQRLEGYAAKYDKLSRDLGRFKEIIRRGAFTDSLAEAERGEKNIFCYWAHKTDQPLGSTKSGKLVLREDDQGLWFSLDVSRLQPWQLDACLDGEMHMSFGFGIIEQEITRSRDGDVYELIKVNLSEISPVTNPAYHDTEAQIRSLEEAVAALDKRDAEVKAEEHNRELLHNKARSARLNMMRSRCSR